MSNKKHLYKISDLPIFQYLVRLGMLACIYFAYTKFEINPIFFGFTMVVALIELLMISETSLTATEESLILKRTRWLPIFNKTCSYKYSEISDIRNEEDEIEGISLLLIIIYYVPGTIRKDSRRIVKKNDGTTHEMVTPGWHDENEELLKLLGTE